MKCIQIPISLNSVLMNIKKSKFKPMKGKTSKSLINPTHNSKCRIGFFKYFANLIYLNFSTFQSSIVTLSAIAICFASKEYASKTTTFMSKFYKISTDKVTKHLICKYSIIASIDCLLISFIYWINPIHLIIISNIVYKNSCLDFLKSKYEDIFRLGPEIISKRIKSDNKAFKSSCSILVFDFIGNVITISSALFKLYKMLEMKIFFKLVLLQIILLILLKILNDKTNNYKNIDINVKEAEKKEMCDILENYWLIKITKHENFDELYTIFKSKSALIHKIAVEMTTLFCHVYFIFINAYILYFSYKVQDNLYNYFKESTFLFSSVKKLLQSYFTIESMRLKVFHVDSFSDIKKRKCVISDDSSASQISDFNNFIEKSSLGFHFSIHNNFSILGTSIALKEIAVFINNSVILDKIDATINIGDKIAIIGKNGSGKSAFIKFLMGFYDYSGNFVINNEDIQKDAGGIRNLSSYISQNMCLEGTLYDVLRSNCDSDAVIIDTLQQFKITNTLQEIKEMSTLCLSQSEKQLIKVIRSYSKPAQVLIADEPIDCLDLEDQELALDLLLNNDRQDIKIISIHNLNYLHKFNKVFVVENKTIKTYVSKKL